MEKTILPGAVEGEVDPPSSKSYAQRAIAAALLADGVSTLRGIELCDDTLAALRVVQALGAGIEQPEPGAYMITGGATDARLSRQILDIGESGLSTRLFTPIASLRHIPVTITGHGSILRRPMDMMLAPLRELGVEVTDSNGFLPLTVRGPVRGGEVEIDGSVSSQFLTGLLMSLPMATRDTTVRVRNLKSIPYINMTLDVMDRFGIEVQHRDYEEFYIPANQQYTPAGLHIEGDWSAASCLLVAGAVSGKDSGGVTVKNLNPVSLQADVAIIDALSRAGARIEQCGNDHGDSTETTLPTERNEVKYPCQDNTVTVSRPVGGAELRAFEFDATDCPDLFPALAALASNCEGTSTLVGTGRLTHKECNRAEAIRSEYGKLGIEVDIDEDNIMRISGGGTRNRSRTHGDITVDSFGDHRMAMSLAVTALNAPVPVTITGAECVSKSYGNFWADFYKLTGRL